MLVSHLSRELECSCNRQPNGSGISYMMDLALVDYGPNIITKDEIIGIIKKTGYDVIPVAN